MAVDKNRQKQRKPMYGSEGAIGNRPSRQEFLRRAAVLAVTAVTAAPATAGIRTPGLHFPTEPRARLGVTSRPFRAFIESPTNHGRDPRKPGMDLKDFPAMVVSRFNLRNVELLSDHFASSEQAYIDGLRNAVEKAGTRIIDLGLSAHGSFFDLDPARRDREITYCKQWVDVAVQLGAPSVRAHIDRAPGVRANARTAAETLTRVVDYSAERNVLVLLENDDLVAEDPFFIVDVITQVSSPYLCALPDFANTLLHGDTAYNYRGLSAMFEHAYNMSHMKDCESGDDGKVYCVDVHRAFSIARSNGYRGYFSMEWGRGGDPFKGTQKLIEESLSNLRSGD